MDGVVCITINDARMLVAVIDRMIDENIGRMTVEDFTRCRRISDDLKKRINNYDIYHETGA